ncbi:MAG: hypothetical protein ACPLYF_00320, partial [Fervidobacterium sp.]
FKQWKYFEKKGVKDRVIEAMKASCKTYVPYQYTQGKFQRTDEQFLRESMTFSILYFHMNFITLLPQLYGMPEQAKQQILEREKSKTLEWVKIWYDNPKLRRYLMMELDRDERESEERFKNVKLVREYIKNLESISK